MVHKNAEAAFGVKLSFQVFKDGMTKPSVEVLAHDA